MSSRLGSFGVGTPSPLRSGDSLALPRPLEARMDVPPGGALPVPEGAGCGAAAPIHTLAPTPLSCQFFTMLFVLFLEGLKAACFWSRL